MIKNILILVLGYFIWIAYFDEAHSANQENQYCDIKTTLIKTVDKNGKTINEESKEIVDTNASKEEKSDEAIKAEHAEELAAIKASN